MNIVKTRNKKYKRHLNIKSQERYIGTLHLQFVDKQLKLNAFC